MCNYGAETEAYFTKYLGTSASAVVPRYVRTVLPTMWWLRRNDHVYRGVSPFCEGDAPHETESNFDSTDGGMGTRSGPLRHSAVEDNHKYCPVCKFSRQPQST